jgi:hypothetical protein
LRPAFSSVVRSWRGQGWRRRRRERVKLTAFKPQRLAQLAQYDEIIRLGQEASATYERHPPDIDQESLERGAMIATMASP